MNINLYITINMSSTLSASEQSDSSYYGYLPEIEHTIIQHIDDELNNNLLKLLDDVPFSKMEEVITTQGNSINMKIVEKAWRQKREKWYIRKREWVRG